MRYICFYFQVHQPFRLKNYHFFDIGEDHYYWDDYANRSIMRKVSEKCYLPTNRLFLELINKHEGKLKISYSLSGTFIDQMELYAPDVLKTFQDLAQTGCVEFLSETYSHSLAALKSRTEFEAQIKAHDKKIIEYFGQTPTVFRNTELVYSDEIGGIIADLGYKAMISEGAKHILGWKSPNFLYCNAQNPKLKLLLKNFSLSDDLAFRFSNRSWSEWPLTTEKYVQWLNGIAPKEEIVNLFMDYETFGEHQWAETGIFEFLRYLPERVFADSDFEFCLPHEVADRLQPVGIMHAPDPVSWADEERDLSAWLGNDLQDDAFNNLYELEKQVQQLNNPDLLRDWKYLQTSDHFYYMCTKFFADGDVHKYFNHYNTPYEAFMNYMNVLTDFTLRVKKEIEQQKNTQQAALVAEKNTEREEQTNIIKKAKAKNQDTLNRAKAQKNKQ